MKRGALGLTFLAIAAAALLGVSGTFACTRGEGIGVAELWDRKKAAVRTVSPVVADSMDLVH
jgi:hypothetical protein